MIIDFDKLYEEYVKKWAVQNSDKLKANKSVENFIDEIYEGFVNSQSDKLDGLSPKVFFDKYNANQLVDFLQLYIEGGVSVPLVLMDKITSSNDGRSYLISKLSTGNHEFVMTAINLINEMPGDLCDEFCETLINILISEDYPDDIKEITTEILIDNYEKVKDRLIEKIDENKLTKTNEFLADILVNAGGEEKVYKLLTDLFLSGKNDPLYAAYLGKYGDTRALSLLYDRLNLGDVNYIEFLEIRNSIERLGGEVTKKLDFSEDPYFKALKNVK